MKEKWLRLVKYAQCAWYGHLYLDPNWWHYDEVTCGRCGHYKDLRG